MDFAGGGPEGGRRGAGQGRADGEWPSARSRPGKEAGRTSCARSRAPSDRCTSGSPTTTETKSPEARGTGPDRRSPKPEVAQRCQFQDVPLPGSTTGRERTPPGLVARNVQSGTGGSPKWPAAVPAVGSPSHRHMRRPGSRGVQSARSCEGLDGRFRIPARVPLPIRDLARDAHRHPMAGPARVACSHPAGIRATCCQVVCGRPGWDRFGAPPSRPGMDGCRCSARTGSRTRSAGPAPVGALLHLPGSCANGQVDSHPIYGFCRTF